MAVEVTAKKWGNSIGVIIPKHVADELGITEGSQVVADFKKPKRTVLEEAFGALHFDESTEGLLQETRSSWSKWIK